MVVTCFEKRNCFRTMTSGQPADRTLIVKPTLGLEAGICFTYIVKENNCREARNIELVERMS